jgi:hypothetical protein
MSYLLKPDMPAVVRNCLLLWQKLGKGILPWRHPVEPAQGLLVLGSVSGTVLERNFTAASHGGEGCLTILFVGKEHGSVFFVCSSLELASETNWERFGRVPARDALETAVGVPFGVVCVVSARGGTTPGTTALATQLVMWWLRSRATALPLAEWPTSAALRRGSTSASLDGPGAYWVLVPSSQAWTARS